MRRVRNKGLTPFAFGVLTIAALVLITYLGFTKAIPFKPHFEVKAVFRSANNLRTNSPVRIAGVNVGKVTEVKRIGGKDSPAAQVTMRVEEMGRPIHEDARAKIRPRIFLEGNFFVDLQPGTPEARKLGDGGTIPIQQTATPVQFDQVLDALDSDTRENLKVLLDEYGRALQGEGAKGYNRSLKYWAPAYKNSATVTDALQGTNPGDLPGYLRGGSAVAEGLDRNPEQLKGLIRDFNTTAGALASRQDDLAALVAELPRTLRTGTPALARLDQALPPVNRLVADLRPGVRSSGPALDASRPFVNQLRGLVAQPELRGLTADLRPTVPALARLTSESTPLMEQLRAFSSCQTNTILPWANDRIPDRNFPAKVRVYQETPQSFVGLGGESRQGDANGQWFRVLFKAGANQYQLSKNRFFSSAKPILGANPPPPPKNTPPAISPKTPCETQEPPDLRSTPGAPPPRAKVSTSPATKAREAKVQAYTRAWMRQQADKLRQEGGR